ncbi:MAG: hypothetical protein GXY34_05260 [Syntrophomonadaceae bacterium]|nr:hypothetical protein [Syntrophomonadaceae bacterium]
MPKRPRPTNDRLRELWDLKKTVSGVALELHVGQPKAREWLEEAGILEPRDNPKTQATEPAQAGPGDQVPNQDEPAEPRVDNYGLGKPGCPPVVMSPAQELPREEAEQDTRLLSDALTDHTYQHMIRGQIAEWAVDVFRMDAPKQVKLMPLDKLLDLGAA